MRDRSPSMWRRLDKLMDHVEDKKEDTETWTKLQVHPKLILDFENKNSYFR